MTLAELLTKYGDDIQFQHLDQCAASLNYHHKKGTTITFGTTMHIGGKNGTEKLGLVVWMDRDRVAEIMAEEKTEQ